MIISGKSVTGIVKAYEQQSRVNRSAATDKKQPVQQQDEVILSSQAQEFGQLLQIAKQDPAVRQDKVDELTKRVESGTYHVAAQEIAAKMLDQFKADRKS